MAQKTICKCVICQIRDIDRDKMVENVDYIHHGTKYYHMKCYKDWNANKDNLETNNDNDNLWRDSTYEFLKHTVKIDIEDKFFHQWKVFINSGKYTAKGIYFSVRYFYEIKHGDKDKSKGGIGIIPFIYKEASQYWVNRENREKGIIAGIERQMREHAAQCKQIVAQQKVKVRKTIDLSFDEGDEEC